MRDRGKGVGRWIIWGGVAGVLALLALYIGAYLWIVQPEAIGPMGGPTEVILPDYTGTDEPYRDHETWERIFGPAHWLDRRVRPGVWSVD